MNFEELRLFVRLATALHFGKAARESHVSPSTLSRAIQRIEEEAGKPLFVRDRRSVSLTRDGQVFWNYAAGALKEWETVRARLKAGAEKLEGELRLFSSVTATYSILPDILDAFTRRHPEVRVQIVTGDANTAVDRVLDQSVDAAIAPLPGRMPRGLSAQEITRTPLVMIGPEKPGPVRDSLRRRRIPWETVPMVAPQAGLMRARFYAWFREKGIKPRIYGHVSGHEAILSLVRLGLGAGMIPRLVLEKSLVKPDVMIVPIRPALPDFRIGFCARSRDLKAPILEAFWKAVGESRKGENV